MELVASGRVSPHFEVMSNELSTPKILVCPNDRNRNYATNFDNDLSDAKLSYFVGVDADQPNAASLLSGDRNLTNKPAVGSRFVNVSTNGAIGWTKAMHCKRGFLGFADSSVGFFTNGSAKQIVRTLVPATSRLAVP